MVYLTNTLIVSHTVGVARLGGLAQVGYALIGGASAPLSGTVMVSGPVFIAPARFSDHAEYRLAPISLAVDGGLGQGIVADYFEETHPQGNAPDIGYVESPITLQRVFAPAVSGGAGRCRTSRRRRIGWRRMGARPLGSGWR